MYTTLRRSHTRALDNPRRCRRRDVGHTDIRVSFLVRTVRENQTRDRLTAAEALVEQPQGVRQNRPDRPGVKPAPPARPSPAPRTLQPPSRVAHYPGHQTDPLPFTPRAGKGHHFTNIDDQ